MTMHRRGLLAAAAGVGVAVASGRRAPASPADATSKARLPGTHVAAPLPFVPGKLKGISEKMIVSHHVNNYGGALRNLNKVELQLAQTQKDTPGFLVAALRDRELNFLNSVVLHELYFANLGGDGKAGAAVEKELAVAFGGYGRWEELFRATAQSLGGGSGWAVLDFNHHTGALGVHAGSNHREHGAFAQPIVVLDMYEHAYHMDYGAAAARYVDAFFQNIQWEMVQKRLQAARRLSALLRN